MNAVAENNSGYTGHICRRKASKELLGVPVGKLLNVAELAHALRIDTRTIRLWRDQSDGLPHVRFGQAIRYDIEATISWLDRRGMKIKRPIKQRKVSDMIVGPAVEGPE